MCFCILMLLFGSALGFTVWLAVWFTVWLIVEFTVGFHRYVFGFGALVWFCV
jgi:hypothetical protein